jgi:hypothetical protein
VTTICPKQALRLVVDPPAQIRIRENTRDDNGRFWGESRCRQNECSVMSHVTLCSHFHTKQDPKMNAATRTSKRTVDKENRSDGYSSVVRNKLQKDGSSNALMMLKQPCPTAQGYTPHPASSLSSCCVVSWDHTATMLTYQKIFSPHESIQYTGKRMTHTITTRRSSRRPRPRTIFGFERPEI